MALRKGGGFTQVFSAMRNFFVKKARFSVARFSEQ